MSAPADVLLVRAASHFERAQLELTAGNMQVAADFVEKGLDLVLEVLER